MEMSLYPSVFWLIYGFMFLYFSKIIFCYCFCAVDSVWKRFSTEKFYLPQQKKLFQREMFLSSETKCSALETTVLSAPLNWDAVRKTLAEPKVKQMKDFPFIRLTFLSVIIRDQSQITVKWISYILTMFQHSAEQVFFYFIITCTTYCNTPFTPAMIFFPNVDY